MAYIGEDISKLGFGLMRLPEFEVNDKKVIDIDQVKHMVDLFIGSGFTYFDTAYGYHGGRSEMAVKEALVKRHSRESFQLATKLPAWAVKTEHDAKKMFATSLERTGAEYFDFYLLHNLGDARTKAFDDFGIWDFVQEKKKAGLIEYFGFSFHDKADELEKVLVSHPEVDFVQLQLNYADWESFSVQSRKCYEVARAHNVPIIVMEPVKGGALTNLPPFISDILGTSVSQAALARWALRFAGSLEGIITVLSGMSNLEQVRDNVAVMKDFKPLSKDELSVIQRVQKALAETAHIPCTDCRYCLKTCPQGIKIPSALSALNIELIYKDLPRAQQSYLWNTENGRGSACIECGACESVCPQHIEIIEELKRAVDLLEVTK